MRVRGVERKGLVQPEMRLLAGIYPALADYFRAAAQNERQLILHMKMQPVLYKAVALEMLHIYFVVSAGNVIEYSFFIFHMIK